ncbi:hypothetical protein J6590_018831, partial [Homalodisca vitripennis]
MSLLSLMLLKVRRRMRLLHLKVVGDEETDEFSAVVGRRRRMSLLQLKVVGDEETDEFAAGLSCWKKKTDEFVAALLVAGEKTDEFATAEDRELSNKHKDNLSPLVSRGEPMIGYITVVIRFHQLKAEGSI